MSKWNPKANEIFCNALEIQSPSGRAAYLDQTCAGDSKLRDQVEDLLHTHENAQSFLQKPAIGLSAAAHATPDGQITGNEGTLARASSGKQDKPATGQSVLGRLRSRLTAVPRVALREPLEQKETPVVKLHASELPNDMVIGRYRLDGEIARGGMGAIIKGRDTDLGRDLALKVLLDSHKDDSEMVQRFIEEAQIGGQLQHPGIAPVFELGQFQDERPFFSMKLVKGKTLAVLLSERDKTDDEQAKFLSIFEQICQTIAYAHSRGVIHRDLKPANIMVGSFGEVQVMDWGLAKVLLAGGVADEKKAHESQQPKSVIKTIRSSEHDTPVQFGSETRMGSVMGTPAYMAPEQAMGEIDRLDERADVFGLGAILCEIISGKPPYVGQDHIDVFQLAFDSNLTECFQRLERCDADTELLQIVRTCLAIEPSDRFRSATVLSKKITDYLQSQQRLRHQAELSQAAESARAEEAMRTVEQETRARTEAQARAAEERKRRRTTMALAISILLFVAALGATAAWIQHERTVAANERTASAENVAAVERENTRQEKEAKETYQQLTYSSDMNRVAMAFEMDNLKSARRILERYRDGDEWTELKGFEWYLWDRICHPAQFILQDVPELFKHRYSPVNMFASTDNQMSVMSIIVQNDDHQDLILWDLATGKQIRSIALTHSDWTNADGGKSIVSKDGKWVAAFPSFGGIFARRPRQERKSQSDEANDAPCLRIWDVQSGQESQTVPLDWEFFARANIEASFSPDNSKIALVRYFQLNEKERALSVIDLKTKKQLFAPTDVSVTGFQTDQPVFSPDGTVIALSADEGTPELSKPVINFYDANNGKKVKSFSGNRGNQLHQPSFNQDGSKIASGTSNQILIWNVTSGERLLAIPATNATTRNIRFSRNDKWLVHFQHSSPTIRGATTGHELLTLRGTGILPFHTVGFASDDRQIKMVNQQGELLTWQIPEPDRTQTSSALGKCHLSRNGSRCAIDSRKLYPLHPDNKPYFDVQIVDASNRVIQTIRVPTDKSRAKTVQFVLNADGTEFAALNEKGDEEVISFWNVNSGERAREGMTIKPKNKGFHIGSFSYGAQGNRMVINEYKLSNDQRRPRSTLVRVVNLDTGKSVFEQNLDQWGYASQISNSGNFVAIHRFDANEKSGKRISSVNLYSISDGTLAQAILGETPIAFSRDDKWLATTNDSTRIIWDLESGNRLLAINAGPNERNEDNFLLFSHDSTRLFECRSRGEGSELRGWNTKNGHLVFEQKCDASQIAFNSDGHVLVGVGFRQMIQTWDATPRELTK